MYAHTKNPIILSNLGTLWFQASVRVEGKYRDIFHLITHIINPPLG